MATTDMHYEVEDHFRGKDSTVREIYERLMNILHSFGPMAEEAKKTSIHLVNKTAFAGVQVQKRAINLTIRASHPIESPRIRNVERVSANRYHLLVKLDTPENVDDELVGWLKAAYGLSG